MAKTNHTLSKKKVLHVLSVLSLVVLLAVAGIVCASAARREFTVTNGATYNVTVGDTIYLTNPTTRNDLHMKAYYWDVGSGDASINIVESGQYATVTFSTGGTKEVTAVLDGQYPVTKYSQYYNSATGRWESYPYETYERYLNKITFTFKVQDNSPPRVTTQPKSQKVAEGKRAKVDFKVYSFLKPLKYTWYYAVEGSNTFKKSTKTDATYSCKMTDGTDGMRVYCIVEDAWGQKVKTNTVTLRMAKKIKITSQPKNKAIVINKKGSVSVEATGDGKLTYTWYYADKGSDKFKKSKQTGYEFSTTMTKERNGRRVYCVIKDKYGQKVQTKTVTLSLSNKLGILTQPKKAYGGPTKEASTSVKIYGGKAPITYRWYYKDKGSDKFRKTSVTSSTYSVEMTDKRDGRKVYCVIRDATGRKVTTKTVTLKQASKVKITTQLTDGIALVGKNANLSLKATGTGTLKYYWYASPPGLNTFKRMDAASANTIQVPVTTSVLGYEVFCVVKDGYGNSAESDVVVIRKPKPINVKKTIIYREDGYPKLVLTVTGGDGEITYEWSDSGDYSPRFKLNPNYTSNYYYFSESKCWAKCVIRDSYGQTWDSFSMYVWGGDITYDEEIST